MQYRFNVYGSSIGELNLKKKPSVKTRVIRMYLRSNDKHLKKNKNTEFDSIFIRFGND